MKTFSTTTTIKIDGKYLERIDRFGCVPLEFLDGLWSGINLLTNGGIDCEINIKIEKEKP